MHVTENMEGEKTKTLLDLNPRPLDRESYLPSLEFANFVQQLGISWLVQMCFSGRVHLLVKKFIHLMLIKIPF